MRSARCVAWARPASRSAHSARTNVFSGEDTFLSELCLPPSRGDHAMRQCFCLLVASLFAVSGAAGVRRLGGKEIGASQSAALFVGIRDFADSRRITSVPYAIDDAV